MSYIQHPFDSYEEFPLQEKPPAFQRKRLAEQS
jgi:hypothetical protein